MQLKKCCTTMSKKNSPHTLVKSGVAETRRDTKIGRMGSVAADLRGQQRMIKEINHDVTQAVLPAMRPAFKGEKRMYRALLPRSLDRELPSYAAGQKAAKKEAKLAKRAVLVPRLKSYLDLLADPWRAEVCKCPVNYNPVPSFLTSLARTTVNTEGVFAAANSSTQIALFPGHGSNSDNDSMDGDSYHSLQQVVNATTYAVGPVVSQNSAIHGIVTVGLALGSAQIASNTAASSPLGPDLNLPYVGQAGSGSHTRWKLLSMGVRIENTTVLGSRAGDIVSVQPSSPAANSYQVSFGSQPTFELSVDPNTGTWQRTWIPRATDMAFWHTITVGEQAADINMYAAGWFIWLNNNSAVTQTYRLEILCLWEMAGANLAAIASPTVLQPADKNIIEPTLDVMKFTGPGSRIVAMSFCEPRSCRLQLSS